jgi:hypothetical protein
MINMWIAGIDVHSWTGVARSSGRNIGGRCYSREPAEKVDDPRRGALAAPRG